MDKISVIVPIYKVEAYLKDCVDSILSQTYKNLEIILVEDGSPDNCGLICDEYAKKDDRIVVIHKENGGVSDARNAGFDVATGNWYCCVDPDDFIHERMIEILHDEVVKNDAKMAWCLFRNVTEDGLLEDGMRPELTEIVSGFQTECMDCREAQKQFYGMELKQESLVTWNKIYAADLFGKGEGAIRFPKNKIFEEGYTLYRLIYASQKVVVVRCPLYFYRQRPGSIMSSNAYKTFEPALEAGLERMEFWAGHKETELYRLEINLGMYLIITFYEKTRNRKDRKMLKTWYRRYYTEHFKKESWTMAKKIRIASFLWGYPVYKCISSFEGLYNKL